MRRYIWLVQCTAVNHSQHSLPQQWRLLLSMLKAIHRSLVKEVDCSGLDGVLSFAVSICIVPVYYRPIHSSEITLVYFSVF